MALTEAALTTLDRVNGELGFTTGDDTDRDALIEGLIDDESDRFARECNRKFYRNTSVIENVEAYGGYEIMVKEHLPIASITMITHKPVGGTSTTIAAGSYRIEDAEVGTIGRTKGQWPDSASRRIGTRIDRIPGTEKQTLEVRYSGGYVTPKQAADSGDPRTLPRDIERLIIDLVSQSWRNLGRDRDVIEEKLGDQTVKWSGYNGETDTAFQRQYERIVGRYRRGGFN